jgi:hypothetical protein
MKGNYWTAAEDAMVDEFLKHGAFTGRCRYNKWVATASWLVENGFNRTPSEVRNRLYRRKEARKRQHKRIPVGSVVEKQARVTQRCSKCGQPRAGHTCRVVDVAVDMNTALYVSY